MLASGHRNEVLRIHTPPLLTGVMQNKTGSYRASQVLVDRSMDVSAATSDTDSSVAMLVGGALPEPARIQSTDGRVVEDLSAVKNFHRAPSQVVRVQQGLPRSARR